MYMKKLRFTNRFINPIKLRLNFELAKIYRFVLRVLGKVCFIGVTGSCGKTTTTELIAAILATEGQVRKGVHQNTARHIAKTILTVLPWHHFCVNEINVLTFFILQAPTL